MTDLAEPVPGVTPAPRTRLLRGYALYLLAALLFALNGVVVKAMLLAGLEAADLSQLRATGAFVILLVFVAVANRSALRIRRAELPLLVAYGVIGIAFTQFLFFVSITTIPISIALLIEFTSPLIVAAWFRFGYGHPTRRIVWVALGTAMLGLAIVGQVWDGLTLDPVGLIAALGAAAAVSFYFVAGDRMVRGEHPRDPVSLTMWGMGFAALFWAVVQPPWGFPFGLFAGSIELVGEGGPTVPVVLPAGWMVVLGTLVPFSLVVLSMQHLRASQASVVGLTEPVIASVIAWIVLGEVLAPVQVVGAAIVLGSIVVVERNR